MSQLPYRRGCRYPARAVRGGLTDVRRGGAVARTPQNSRSPQVPSRTAHVEWGRGNEEGRLASVRHTRFWRGHQPTTPTALVRADVGVTEFVLLRCHRPRRRRSQAL